jgi:hypothetical protein
MMISGWSQSFPGFITVKDSLPPLTTSPLEFTYGLEKGDGYSALTQCPECSDTGCFWWKRLFQLELFMEAFAVPGSPEPVGQWFSTLAEEN